MFDFEKDVRESIASVIDEDSGSVNLESVLADEYGFDDLSMIELVFSLEEKFGIVITDEAAEKFLTGRDVVKYLEVNVK